MEKKEQKDRETTDIFARENRRGKTSLRKGERKERDLGIWDLEQDLYRIVPMIL